MSNKVTVTLDGRRYNLVSDSDTKYMEAVAEYVNECMLDVRASMQNRSGVDCATLTALNLADDLYQERLASAEIRKQLIEALNENQKLATQLKEANKQPKPQKKSARGRTKAVEKTPQEQVQLPLAGEFVPEEK